MSSTPLSCRNLPCRVNIRANREKVLKIARFLYVCLFECERERKREIQI